MLQAIYSCYAKCRGDIKNFIKNKYPFTKNIYNFYTELTHNIKHVIRNKYHFMVLILCVFRNYSLLQWRKYKLMRERPSRQIIAISLIEHFGDIVACEPVSRYIRHLYPKAYIIWFVRKPYRELIAYNPFVDQVAVLHCLTEWIALTKSKFFDDIVDLHIQERICPICRLPLRKVKGCSDITLENYYRFGGLLSVFSQGAGLPPLHDQPAVYIPHKVRAKVNGFQLPSEFIVIHCLSNEASRDWEPLKWQELIERLTMMLHCNVVEVGLKPLVDERLPNYLSLCGQLSLLETAEVIQRAKLFIGIDSGPAQLANAVGTFGIILLGHYRAFQRYSPYSGNFTTSTGAHLLYEDGPVAAMSVERVYQAVEMRLDEPYKTISSPVVTSSQGTIG